eukprot:TRINITY_DN11229_c0_g1_i5.p1 TRINITY_DN11229_c0_g1~~TRINITY_DN11229_c0_g1_i5.p1  ORF type:complete len:120 (+),score=5.01 TRINITY_DN11229_c0_g1_i5:241-600(+)
MATDSGFYWTYGRPQNVGQSEKWVLVPPEDSNILVVQVQCSEFNNMSEATVTCLSCSGDVLCTVSIDASWQVGFLRKHLQQQSFISENVRLRLSKSDGSLLNKDSLLLKEAFYQLDPKL